MYHNRDATNAAVRRSHPQDTRMRATKSYCAISPEVSSILGRWLRRSTCDNARKSREHDPGSCREDGSPWDHSISVGQPGGMRQFPRRWSRSQSVQVRESDRCIRMRACLLGRGIGRSEGVCGAVPAMRVSAMPKAAENHFGTCTHNSPYQCRETVCEMRATVEWSVQLSRFRGQGCWFRPAERSAGRC